MLPAAGPLINARNRSTARGLDDFRDLWFSKLLHARGEDVLRVEELVNGGWAGPVLLNGVQH